jgi:uncharacterized membrane protein
MHTKLIFFDSMDESVKGTIRGAVAFILIVIFDYIWYELIMKKFYDKYISNVSICKKTLGIVVSSLLLCSAIAVEIASSPWEAFVYGALVGLVVHGCYNFFNLYSISGWDMKITIIDTLFGVISLGISSFIIYTIFLNKKLKVAHI